MADDVREADHIDYDGWDGSRFRSQRHGRDQFLHSFQNGTGSPWSSDHINYRFHLQNWQAKWSGDKFFQYRDGDAGNGRVLDTIEYDHTNNSNRMENWKCYWDGKKQRFIHIRL